MRFHGVLLEVEGVGVLLAGPSGSGKSACALELVARGQKLVADDAIELSRVDGSLRGRAAAATAGHLEVRGLGILEIADLYGPGALAEECEVELLCQVVEDAASCDRTGLGRAQESLLGVELPLLRLPVGRSASLATLIDAAARDQRRRRVGHCGAERFDRRLRERLGGS